MQAIPIDKVKPGMVIARAVIGSKGEILLSSEVKIDDMRFLTYWAYLY